ncbi:MAG: peptidoglycan editing factor PgeF [Bryobacteraceae bacterium]|jgi:YfiH family protein
MFYLDSNHFYRVSELDDMPWLLHGFGTRQADIPARFKRLATLKQIHSAECVAAAGRSGVLGTGDALLENTPGAVVAVKTADCVPLLLVDPRHRAVAAVHAGWRGTVAGIAQRAVAALGTQFGVRAGDLHAAIGPAIGKCCYEVGAEVAAQFGLNGRAHIDLAEEVRRQLEAAGVGVQRIYVAGLCTKCRADEFHSFRRDGAAAGRLYSFAGIV